MHGDLLVRVNWAKSLSKPTTFAKIQVKGSKKHLKTSTVKDTNNPSWFEGFRLTPEDWPNGRAIEIAILSPSQLGVKQAGFAVFDKPTQSQGGVIHGVFPLEATSHKKEKYPNQRIFITICDLEMCKGNIPSEHLDEKEVLPFGKNGLKYVKDDQTRRSPSNSPKILPKRLDVSESVNNVSSNHGRDSSDRSRAGSGPSPRDSSPGPSPKNSPKASPKAVPTTPVRDKRGKSTPIQVQGYVFDGQGHRLEGVSATHYVQQHEGDYHVESSGDDEELVYDLETPRTRKLGDIFDIGGRHLVGVYERHPFVIAGTVFKTQQNKSNGALKLMANEDASDDRTNAHQRAVVNAMKQLSDIEVELEQIKGKIEAEVKADNPNLASEIRRLMKRKTELEETAEAMNDMSTIDVTYKMQCRVATLMPGVGIKLSWFRKPVMWCPETEEEVEITEITEQMPVTAVVNAAHDHIEWVVSPEVMGLMYASGGAHGNASDCLERFLPAEQRWEKVACMSEKRFNHALAVLGNQIYAVGGRNSKPLASVERYNPQTNTWTTVSPMLSPRCYHGVAVVNNYLYVVGGSDGGNYLHSVERYDPIAGKWEEVAPMKIGRRYHAVGVLRNSIYACGGMSDAGQLSETERYDPATNTWSLMEKSSMCEKRYCHALGVVGDKMYVIGGSGAQVRLASIEVFDPSTETWRKCGEMKNARRYHAVATIGKMVYVTGGNADMGKMNMASIEVLDTELNTWATVADMTTSRCKHCAIAL